MKKEDTYLNLDKLNLNERIEVMKILPAEPHRDAYNIFKSYKYLQFVPKSEFQENEKWFVDKSSWNKTEISFQQFKEMMKNVENKCCDNPEIRWNKVEINVGDKQGSYKDLSFDFCDNCGEVFNEELN